MTGKVEAVVENWFPRFLANGVDYLDARRILDAVDEWDDWAPAWTASADRYAALGEEALAAGHRVTAAEHLRRAALTVQFAQFVLTEDPAARLALQRRQVDLYARAAPLLDPPAARVEIPYEAGSGAGATTGTVVGYLRLPTDPGRPGLVVLLPGLESTKEQFSTYEPYFLRRGVATLSVEGPGQGEAGWEVPFRSPTYAAAMAAVAEHVAGRTDVDPHRLVVLGTSFGGHLALRHADAFSRRSEVLRGGVDIAGPYDVDLDELQPVTCEGFTAFTGADDETHARALLADVTLDGVAGPEGPPVLVLHGERDTVIDPRHARRIAAALGDRADVHLEPEGNHSCQNLATVVRPLVADWVADRLVPPDRQERPVTHSQPSTASALGLTTVGHHDLAGCGDGMQVQRVGDALYVGHFGPSGMGTSILDVSEPTDPRLVSQWRSPAGSHTHKVQVADGLLLVNHEQFRGGDPYSAGMAVHDLSDPFAPEQVGWFESTGRGVHRIVWTGGRYAYVSAIPDGFDDRIWVVVDMSDPTHPTEAGRWWWPGQWTGGGETPAWPEGRRYAAHHALLDGDLGYLGYGDGGLVVLDVSDPSAPTRLGNLSWSPGGDTHTCLPLPGRDLLVVTDETVTDRCAGEEHLVRLVDVADPREPRVVATCPPPEGDFCERGLRFGPHNTHENRPGSYRSADLVFVTYFNAGLRVYDVSDATTPVEVAHWIPETPPGQEAVQINDVFVAADHLVYVTDRVGGGVYVVRPDERLSTRMTEATL